MTAIRVVENHLELENIGDLQHSDIDNLLTGSSFLVLATPSGTLSQARVFSAGPGITINDGGPGGIFAVSASAVSTEIVWNETPGGILNSTNRTFTLSFTPTNADKMMVFHNGMLMTQGSGSINGDFFLSGSSIIFNDKCLPPDPSAILRVTYERLI